MHFERDLQTTAILKSKGKGKSRHMLIALLCSNYRKRNHDCTFQKYLFTFTFSLECFVALTILAAPALYLTPVAER